MLHEFLQAKRAVLISQCRMKAATRAAPSAIDESLAFGIPLFLDQLIKTLQFEHSVDPMQSRRVSGQPGGIKWVLSEIGTSARRYGHEMMQCGATVSTLVHHYGDLCQAITDLAVESGEPIQVGEFRTLNCCLDNAIADAVTEFAYEHELKVIDQGMHLSQERLGSFAHELRNLVTTATYAMTAIKSGQVGLSGPTGTILDRSLQSLRRLIDRELTDARLGHSATTPRRLIGLAGFVTEVRQAATLEAKAHGCMLAVNDVDPQLAVDVDRDLLFSAVNNLLQNAFKFTNHGTEVTLSAYATASRVRIDVEDRCGGLPQGDVERLFTPFAQHGENKSGAGLGLSICRRSVEACNGTLNVRDVPNTGCVFTIDLPRHELAETFYLS